MVILYTVFSICCCGNTVLFVALFIVILCSVAIYTALIMMFSFIPWHDVVVQLLVVGVLISAFETERAKTFASLFAIYLVFCWHDKLGY